MNGPRETDYPLVKHSETLLPSIKDGLPKNEARMRIRNCCAFIEKVAKTLEPNMKLISTCTAMVFLHRFFARQSLLKHDQWLVATACIFLASKVEEDFKKISKVIDAAHQVRTKQKFACLSEKKEAYVPVRERVLVCERILLHTMQFDVSYIHPHVYAVKLVKQIGGSDTLKKTMWVLLNDARHTPLCLEFRRQCIAASAVVLACKLLSHNDATATMVAKANEALKTMVRETGNYFGDHTRDTVAVIMNQMLDGYEYAERNKSRGGSKLSMVASAATSTMAPARGSTSSHDTAAALPAHKRQRKSY